MTDVIQRFGYRVLEDLLEARRVLDARSEATFEAGDDRSSLGWSASEEFGSAGDRGFGEAPEAILAAALQRVRNERSRSGWLLPAAGVLILAAVGLAMFFKPRWDGQRTEGLPLPEQMELLLHPEAPDANMSQLKSVAHQLHIDLAMAIRQCVARGELTAEDRATLRSRLRELGSDSVEGVASGWQVVAQCAEKDREPVRREQVEALMQWIRVTVRNYHVMLRRARGQPRFAAEMQDLEEFVRMAIQRLDEALAGGG